MEQITLAPAQSSYFRINQHSTEEHSDTVRKTNCCALDIILVGLALLFGFATVALTFLVDPIFVFGIIPALAFTILGIKASENSKPAILPGQPVGLRNGGRNLCYINSAIQFFECSRYYRKEALQKPELEVLKDIHEGIIAAQKKGEAHADKVDTEIFREHLINHGYELSEDGQEDTAVPVRAILQQGFPALPIKEVLSNPKQPQVSHPRWEQQWLDVAIPTGNFLRDFFDNFRETAQGSNVFIREFEHAPEELFICLKRFDSTPTVVDNEVVYRERKITTPITFAENKKLLIGKHLVRENPDKVDFFHYDCNALIKHTGGSSKGGHYIAYTKKIIDGKETYWKCDDNCITQISKEIFWKEDHSVGHIYWMHFNKI